MKLSFSVLGLAVLSGALLLAQGDGHMGGPGSAPGFGFSHAKVVTGEPYSADTSTVMLRNLSDGNTIEHDITGKVARDSQGRTYEEHTSVRGGLTGAGQKTTIFISDPVAGFAYTLNPTEKIAYRRAIRPPSDNPRWEGRGPGHAANVTESDLPADSSSGVFATGKSRVRTIPAGTVGNAQPIVSTDQTWYSPDLQIVVKSIRNDPRFGKITYSLTNVVAKDPDPSLFSVPNGYAVQDAAPGHRGMQ